MRYTTVFLVALIVVLTIVLLAVAPARGAWGSVPCAPVGAFVPASLPFAGGLIHPAGPMPALTGDRSSGAILGGLLASDSRVSLAGYSWEDDGEGGAYLWDQSGKQAGYLWSDGSFQPRYGPKRYGPQTEPPIPRPSWVRRNFGVLEHKIDPTPRWILNGRDVSQSTAIGAIEAGVPDDRSKPRVVVVGAEADRKRVLADFDSHSGLSAFKGKVLVQAYAPDDPLNKGLKYPVGSPTIAVIRADGAVLARNKSGKYEGPDHLAQSLPAALRRADPDYDPEKDPDLKPPAPPPPPAPPSPPGPAPAPAWPDLSKVPPGAWAVAGVGVVLLALTLVRRHPSP